MDGDDHSPSGVQRRGKVVGQLAAQKKKSQAMMS
jgi:hypothetical protein